MRRKNFSRSPTNSIRSPAESVDGWPSTRLRVLGHLARLKGRCVGGGLRRCEVASPATGMNGCTYADSSPVGAGFGAGDQLDPSQRQPDRRLGPGPRASATRASSVSQAAPLAPSEAWPCRRRHADHHRGRGAAHRRRWALSELQTPERRLSPRDGSRRRQSHPRSITADGQFRPPRRWPKRPGSAGIIRDDRETAPAWRLSVSLTRCWVTRGYHHEAFLHTGRLQPLGPHRSASGWPPVRA